MAMAYENSYQHESDADDEFERSSVMSPTLPPENDYESSPTDSEQPSAQHTPTTYTHTTVNAVSPRGLVTQWTPEQCADFISSLGLDKYGDSIIDEAVDGEALIAMQHSDLKDMGVTSVGHRLTILKGVYEVKLKQNIPIEADHYVPLSADANAPDAHATQDDVARIINQIKLRDERIMTAEAELRQLREDMDRILEDQRKLRDDTLPLARWAKENSKPLPTPTGLDGAAPSPLTVGHSDPMKAGSYVSLNLNGKTSKRNLFSNSTAKLPSPTIHDAPNLDPSAAALAASNHLTASMSSGAQGSPHLSNQPSPTSPQYGQPPMSRTNTSQQIPSGSRSAYPGNDSNEGTPWGSQNGTPNTDPDRSTQYSTIRRPGTNAGPPSGSSTGSQGDTSDPGGFMKSFRVSMEEPCHKVLPVALKKYHIQDDWRQYSLYIVHGDQERCLGLDERPLILFKQLANEGKKPMFMLRKHAAPQDGFAHTRTDTSNTGTGSGGSLGGTNNTLGTPTPGGRASYASTVQLPGGVL